MTVGWLPFLRLRLPCPDENEMIAALRDLVVAQSDSIADLRKLLLEEKRVSRSVAEFAVETCEAGFYEMASQLREQLADRVARAEEHQL